MGYDREVSTMVNPTVGIRLQPVTKLDGSVVFSDVWFGSGKMPGQYLTLHCKSERDAVLMAEQLDLAITLHTAPA